MAKYDKLAEFKKPREKGCPQELSEAKKNKRKTKPSTKKSGHKHLYKKVVIVAGQEFGYHFVYFGGQCTICGKLKYKKFLFTDDDIQEYTSKYDVVYNYDKGD